MILRDVAAEVHQVADAVARSFGRDHTSCHWMFEAALDLQQVVRHEQAARLDEECFGTSVMVSSVALPWTAWRVLRCR